MNTETNKICPYCAEQIKASAKICPRCQQWLTTCSLRNPTVFIGSVCLCGLISLFVAHLHFQRLLEPLRQAGIDFSAYRDSISVIESRMNLEKGDKESSVNVVAVITNKSVLAWKEVEMDTRFFDKTGTMIDAQTVVQRWTILPHSELAFRIKITPSRDMSEYDSYKIYVRSAKDARVRF